MGGENKIMFDIKIEKSELYRDRNKGDLSGFNIAIRTGKNNHWNTLSLTTSETKELTLKLLKVLLE